MAKKRIATFLGPNKGLSIAGDHALAYSGKTGCTNNPSTCLEFTTGNYSSAVTLQFLWLDTNDEYTADDGLMFVYLNDASVGGILAGSSHGASLNTTADFVIPPYTAVKVTGENASGGSTEHFMWVMLTGRIYDA